MIGENNITKFHAGTCQHKIQPSIYPQQVLKSCHSVKLSTIHLFQLKLIQICGAQSSKSPFFLFFVYFQLLRNYVLYKQALWKMFAAIIFSSSTTYSKFIHSKLKNFFFHILQSKTSLFFSFVHTPECAYCKIGKLVNCKFICLSFQLCTRSGMC